MGQLLLVLVALRFRTVKDVHPFPITLDADVIGLGENTRRFGTEKIDDLLRFPGIEAAFMALGIRVQGRGEGRALGQHFT